MNDTAQIIIAVATLVTSIGTIILGLVNRKDIVTVREQTNGMMKKLEAEANLQGRADERAEFPRGHPH